MILGFLDWAISCRIELKHFANILHDGMKITMLLYLYIIWDKFSLVVTTCSNGANPAQNVNGFTKTCTVASDCGEPATCENQICCPAPIQEGKILDK